MIRFDGVFTYQHYLCGWAALTWIINLKWYYAVSWWFEKDAVTSKCELLFFMTFLKMIFEQMSSIQLAAVVEIWEESECRQMDKSFARFFSIVVGFKNPRDFIEIFIWSGVIFLVFSSSKNLNSYCLILNAVQHFILLQEVDPKKTSSRRREHRRSRSRSPRGAEASKAPQSTDDVTVTKRTEKSPVANASSRESSLVAKLAPSVDRRRHSPPRKRSRSKDAATRSPSRPRRRRSRSRSR